MLQGLYPQPRVSVNTAQPVNPSGKNLPPRLIGPMRPQGWRRPQTFRPQARVLCAMLGAMHAIAPIGQVNSEQVGLEMIDHVDQLDTRALYLLHFMLGVLARLSQQRNTSSV
jgi:hypothetical protein